MTPQRIQRRRTKGWRMPEGAVYVGRPSRWLNPWRVGASDGRGSTYDVERVLDLYRRAAIIWARQDPEWLVPLRGHDLACWCPLDQPCHADVLLELANP